MSFLATLAFRLYFQNRGIKVRLLNLLLGNFRLSVTQIPGGLLFSCGSNPLLWSSCLPFKSQLWQRLGIPAFPCSRQMLIQALLRQAWFGLHMISVPYSQSHFDLDYDRKRKTPLLSRLCKFTKSRFTVEKVYCWDVLQIYPYCMCILLVLFPSLVFCTAGYCSVKHVNRLF